MVVTESMATETADEMTGEIRERIIIWLYYFVF
jgi:hypothetical protein